MARFRRNSQGRKKKQDKRRGRKSPLSEAPLPAVRAVAGAFAGIGNGVKIQAVISSLRSLSPKAYCHKEKIGVNPRKGANMSKKEKFPLYLSPEKKAILERRYQEDGSQSITAFIDRKSTRLNSSHGDESRMPSSA